MISEFSHPAIGGIEIFPQSSRFLSAYPDIIFDEFN